MTQTMGPGNDSIEDDGGRLHVWLDLAGTVYVETDALQQARSTLRLRAFADLSTKGPRPAKDQDVADQYDQMLRIHGSNSAVFEALGMPSTYWQELSDRNLDYAELINVDRAVSVALFEIGELTNVSLLTNASSLRTNLVLDALGISPDFFTHLLTAESFSRAKPDLEPFLLAIRLSGLGAPSNLYVGDRIDVDILPARKAGMQTCYLGVEHAVGDYRVSSMTDVVDVVRKLTHRRPTPESRTR